MTDKRLFTPEGELREEYRFLDQPTATSPPGVLAPAPPIESLALAPPLAAESADDGPSFFDLLAMIAEPASLYLGDLTLPDGQSAEDVEMARLHIELLAMLRRKTAGNLTDQESMVLDDTLARLQMRYVEKRS